MTSALGIGVSVALGIPVHDAVRAAAVGAAIAGALMLAGVALVALASRLGYRPSGWRAAQRLPPDARVVSAVRELWRWWWMEPILLALGAFSAFAEGRGSLAEGAGSFAFWAGWAVGAAFGVLPYTIVAEWRDRHAGRRSFLSRGLGDERQFWAPRDERAPDVQRR